MNPSQILPGLFVGACPMRADDIDHLKADYGINAILNLQTDHDFDYLDLDFARLEARCKQLGVELRRVPIRDFDGLDLQHKLPQSVEVLNALLSAGRTVYVHCNLGMSRSPSVVVAYLVWKRGWDLDEAVDHVTRCRSCSPNIEAIVLASKSRAAA